MTPGPTFQTQVQDYLEERRRLGFALAIPGTQLMAFARHLDQVGHRGPLTMAAILGWVQGRATRATPFTWARRLDVVRPFARHLARTIPGTVIPDRGRFGPSHRRLTPHIYSDAELVGLLAAAERLPPPGTLRPATYRTFFGLVAATGLRLSEALRLCCADVDLVGGVLTIRQTKFAKSRLVPLHSTTVAELSWYDELRRRHVPAVPGAPFFTSAKGIALASRTVHDVFARIRSELGWVARGTHPAPRIHDLRHTFICRRVALWQAHGADLDHTAVTLADLDAQLILAFLDHLEHDRGNGARSRNARLAAIRSFLRYAVHHDLTAMAVIERALAVPMKRFDRPLLGHLNRAEMQAILDVPDKQSWAGQRDRALLAVMYNTGARVSEVLALHLGDVVLDTTPCVHIQGKGRKQRTVPLWRSTATLLRQWQRRQGHPAATAPLFPNRDGAPMGRGNVAQRLTLYARAAAEGCPSLAGRTVTPHTIRHTTAMHLLQSGVDIAVIALWLGHASPATTHMHLEADLSMKESAIGRLTPPGTASPRYRPPDRLISFLQRL